MTGSDRQAWCAATSRSSADTGCSTNAAGRRPGSRRVHRRGRDRRRRRPGLGRSPRHPGGRVATRRNLRRPGRSAHPPAGVREPGRPAPCRNGAYDAARTHQHRAPSLGRQVDPAAHGSTGAASTGSPPCPTWRPTGIRPAQPGPTRLPPVRSAGQCCGGCAARSSPEPARRSACRTVDVVAEKPPHRQPHHQRPPRNGQVSHPPPITAAPASTPAHTRGNATPAPVHARRQPPRHRPDRCDRSPPATNAEAEPGNDLEEPPTQSTTPTHVRPPWAGITEYVPEPDTAANDNRGVRAEAAGPELAG